MSKKKIPSGILEEKALEQLKGYYQRVLYFQAERDKAQAQMLVIIRLLDLPPVDVNVFLGADVVSNGAANGVNPDTP